ncbi:wd-40 repeat protein [Plasmopara halstedii]|uniref:Wd-40 repeat protein n=1 Tax=Plasmopara halstedii TaxID=4781 RepID=A0A0P1ALI7_PLAHL|nr:wd-40 repeat protein [Plasmopara halstedii]CEG41845.1 wd-40 repeat protein [Plasmopara halstedii]|eukprot:XP_024578214.1 wd-40 repeat protein [Plasmopara halstedii]
MTINITTMDPAIYNDDSYRSELLRKMRTCETIVYRAIFAPKNFTGGQTILVAATSSGLLHIYQLDRIMKPTYWDRVGRGEVTAFPGPNLSFQAHPTQIYSLLFVGDVTNPLLISGGDQDFRVWKWKDILAAMENPLFAERLKPVHIDQLKRKTLGFRKALLPAFEINEIAVSKMTGHLFLAGGDSLAHEWDITTQQFSRQFQGSEDGTLGIWDVRQDRKVEFLQAQPATPTDESLLPSLWQTCSWSSTA